MENKTIHELSISVACLLDEPNCITIGDLHQVQDLVTKLEDEFRNIRKQAFADVRELINQI